jgi:hypothetical protein
VRAQATFRLFGADGLTAGAVTERLAIEPSREFERGDPVGNGSSDRRSSSAWLLAGDDDVAEGSELAPQLGTLLGTLQPKTDLLWDLVGEGYRASWFCFVACRSAEHAVRIDRALLARLLFMPGDLVLDVRGD